MKLCQWIHTAVRPLSGLTYSSIHEFHNSPHKYIELEEMGFIFSGTIIGTAMLVYSLVHTLL